MSAIEKPADATVDRAHGTAGAVSISPAEDAEMAEAEDFDMNSSHEDFVRKAAIVINLFGSFRDACVVSDQGANRRRAVDGLIQLAWKANFIITGELFTPPHLVLLNVPLPASNHILLFPFPGKMNRNLSSQTEL